jgi:glycosyltransferase involved in cell wall biosynthesis
VLKLKKILYIYPGKKSSFISKDIEIIGLSNAITDVSFSLSKKHLIVVNLLKQFIFFAFQIKHFDLIIIKFGGYWSLIPVFFAKYFRKKSIIITGGTDCVSFPEINYGNFNKLFMSVFTKYSFQFTDHIIFLHLSMWESNYKYSNFSNKKQGLKTYIPNLKTNYTVVSNGYSSEKWKKNKNKIGKSFLTVGTNLENEKNRLLKGIDLILNIAPQFPQAQFTIIGAKPDSFNLLPANVCLIASVNHDEIINYYSQAEFYLQLSLSEGFPNSLCEAMLCECVPIVSDVASMPYIIGDSGFVLAQKNINQLKTIIEQAISIDTKKLGQLARQRIAQNFSEEKRAEELRKVITDLLN